jgi:hypothetical protein
MEVIMADMVGRVYGFNAKGDRVPVLTRAEVLALPLGTRVSGLAPIGNTWLATVSRTKHKGFRYLKPDGDLPTSEFAPCDVYHPQWGACMVE